MSQAQDADEMSPVVNNIQVEDHLELVRPLLKGPRRLADSHLLGKCEQVGRHQTSRGLLGIGEMTRELGRDRLLLVFVLPEIVDELVGEQGHEMSGIVHWYRPKDGTDVRR